VDGLTAPGFLALLADESALLCAPLGLPRRTGVEEHMPDLLEGIGDDIRSVSAAVEKSRYSPEDALETGTHHALEMTSLLYASGAAHAVWRRWASLSAFGRFLLFATLDGLQCAILAQEWVVLDALPERRPDMNFVSEEVIWAVASDDRDFEPRHSDDDRMSLEWLRLYDGIMSGDEKAVGFALHALIEIDADEFGDHWERYLPWDYPVFDPSLCSVVSLARRRNLMPRGLDDHDRWFLEPGLADEAPEPLFTRWWPSPSPLRQP
jgi:hypothetical protein